MARTTAIRRRTISTYPVDYEAFGWVARGEADSQSNVDLLVDLEPGRSLFDLASSLMDLQNLLGRKVDNVTENGLHWYIRDRVRNEAVRF
jgi:predicted nucleotidyltransferase